MDWSHATSLRINESNSAILWFRDSCSAYPFNKRQIIIAAKVIMW